MKTNMRTKIVNHSPPFRRSHQGALFEPSSQIAEIETLVSNPSTTKFLVNMEVLEADFMQMALKEEIEAQDNCLDDEKEFGPISSSRDDHHLIQVNFTKDIHDTEKLIQKKNEAYSQIAEKLLERTADRDLVILKLRNLHWNYSKYALSWRRNEMETLQECLKEFQPSKNPNPSRGRDSQRVIIGKSSPPGYRVISKFEHQPLQYSNSFWLRKNEVENLQNCLLELHHSKNLIRARKAIVKSLNYKMQHGSNSLAEEKKLLREIKQNEAKMDNIKLNNNSNNNNVNHASEAAQIRYCLGSRKDIQAYIQFIRNELEGLQEEDRKHTANIQRLKRELKAIERNISSLRNKLADINREKHEACECLLQLKKKGGDKEATKLPPM